VLSQSPSAEEVAACVEALKDFESLAAKEKRPAQHARAALIHALLNHNDFVTIR
jgi:hypothetical protein